MDASQYKDYVLTLLFLKYVSDKYAGKPNALVRIPSNGSFEDIVKLRESTDIGEKINKVLRELALGVHRAVLTSRKSRWPGNVVKENRIRYAVGEVLEGDEELTDEVFDIVKSQPEYRC